MSKKWQNVSVLGTIIGNLGFRTRVSFDTSTGHQNKTKSNTLVFDLVLFIQTEGLAWNHRKVHGISRRATVWRQSLDCIGCASV